MRPYLLLLTLIASSSCALAATGGPDMFGYTWVDSSEPMGPPFMPVDITMTGLLVGSGDDVGFVVNLTTPFDFYGVVYNSFEMSTNSFLSTAAGSGNDLSNDCPLPTPPTTGSGGRLYLVHDDTDCEAGIGSMYYEYFAACPRPADRGANTGCSVFMWDQVSHYPGGGGAPTWDQWILLYDSGDIVYQVGTGNPEQGSSSTTAIMNPAFNDALTVACNSAASIPNDYAVHYLFPVFGPTCTATGPVAPAGGDIQVDFTPAASAAMFLDTITFEYSTDAGVTYQPATASGASSLPNPALMVPTAVADSFTWDTVADSVGATMIDSVEFRISMTEGMMVGECTTPFDVDNLATCTLAGPGATATADIPIDITTTSPIGAPSFDISFEYSVDAGATYIACTAAVSSALGNPAISVPAGGPDTFLWDSRTDMIGLLMIEPAVLVRASINDGSLVMAATCTTSPIDIDNTSLCTTFCGDCDLNGSGPDIVDALTAAQIDAGLSTASMAQQGCCDANFSMGIDIVDAMLMAQAAASFPVALSCP